jgi:hypothetical protein
MTIEGQRAILRLIWESAEKDPAGQSPRPSV